MMDLHLAGGIRGAPFHGLCKAGLLYEIDGATPVINPATGLHRACTQINGRFVPYGGEYIDTLWQDWYITCTATARAPGTPPVTRTQEEQALDANYGHTWLDWLPIPRSETATYLHGKSATDTIKRRYWLLAKAMGDIWLMRGITVAFNQGTGIWTIIFTGKRYGRWGGDPETTQQVLPLTGVGVPVGYRVHAQHLGWDTLAMDETEDGQRVLLGLCEWYGTGPKAPYKRLIAIVEVDFSDWPDAPFYTIVADYQDCVGWSQGTSAYTYGGHYEFEDIGDDCQADAFYTDHSSTTHSESVITVWAWYDLMGNPETVTLERIWDYGGTSSLAPLPSGYWDRETTGWQNYNIEIKVSGAVLWSGSVAVVGESTLSGDGHTAVHTGSVLTVGDWAIQSAYPLDSEGYYDGDLDESLACKDKPSSGSSGSSGYLNDVGDGVFAYVNGLRLLKARRIVMIIQDSWDERQDNEFAIAAVLTPEGAVESGYTTGLISGVQRFAYSDEHGLIQSPNSVHWR